MQKRIVFYDGECGLCQRSVQLLIKIDKNEKLHFAPLQGKTAKLYIPKNRLIELDTIYFFSEKKLFKKSDAIIEILKITQCSFWSFLKFIPHFIRDKMYDSITKRRHWSKPSSCLLGQDHRFLD